MIHYDPLVLPVGALLRPIEPLHAEDSLRRAATQMRRHGLTCLPVAINGQMTGCVTQEALTRAMAFGIEDRSPVGAFITCAPPLIANSATGAEALRMFEETQSPVLVVVDAAGHVMGVLSPLDLLVPSTNELRPKMVGGMATPFGVYLTTGSVRAGAGGWALVATGATLFGLFLVANVLANLADPLVRQTFAHTAAQDLVLGAGALALFMAGMRSMPLAGVHAAEHMVVHAMERGEELVPEVVARMPRVHPRCGTNLAAAAMLFLGVQGIEWLGPDPETRLLLAALVTLFLWRPLGSLMQYYVTTRRPTRSQIESGIRAARELIERHQVAPKTLATPWRRLANSGLPQILAGSLALTLLLQLLQLTTGFLSELKVYF